MTVNMPQLEQTIKTAKMGKRQLAAEIGMDQATFYRKMQSNGKKFTVGEMHRLIDALEISAEEAANIFLFRNSQ